jgi:hypothetical protein
MAKTNKIKYSKADLVLAKNAMLTQLESINNGKLIPGCCTQGCCGEPQAIEYYKKEFFNIKPLDKVTLAKASLLKQLEKIPKGVLVAGCCTQGCCEVDKSEWVIRWPDSKKRKN